MFNRYIPSYILMEATLNGEIVSILLTSYINHPNSPVIILIFVILIFLYNLEFINYCEKSWKYNLFEFKDEQSGEFLIDFSFATPF